MLEPLVCLFEYLRKLGWVVGVDGGRALILILGGFLFISVVHLKA